ncbi:Hypothetical predicted protein [Cloeon dipterum]|uniref:Uncharacterized protein n=1 Tax=Cloeon dipterum TaxID=197152 RepID=A0A8S1DW65_9INSE|nr:Hypothetical predicted protein [Cloeon dipterum]
MASKPSSRTRIFGKDEDLKLQPSESSRFNSSAFTFFIPIEHHGMNVAAIRDKNREAWGNATNFLLSSKARGFPLWKKFEEQIRSKGSTILGKPHIPTVLQHISFDFDVENEDLFDVPVESTILVQLPFQPTLLFHQQSLTHDENGEGFSHQHKMKKYLTERFSSEAIEKLDLDVLKKDQDFSNVICKAKNAEQLWQMTQIKNKDRQGVFGDALVINALNDYEDALMVVASWIVNKFKLSPKHFGIKGLTSNCKLDSDYLLQVIKNSKGVTFSLQGVLQSIWKLDFTLEKSKQNTIFEQFGKKFETRIRDIVLKCIETHLKIENFEEEKDEVLRDWQVVQYLLPCFVASYLDWCETVPQIDLRDRKRRD